jgi:hypothetical protein
LTLSTVGLNPVDDITRDQVDLIEINHFHDEHGRLVFDQIIFYDWCDEKCRFQVRAWRLLKTAAQMPRRDLRNNGYVAMWRDGDVTREVQAKSLRESWTQYDPEQSERKYLADTRRRELTKPKSPIDVPRRPRMTPESASPSSTAAATATTPPTPLAARQDQGR